MSLTLTVQCLVDHADLPANAQFHAWVQAVLTHQKIDKACELTIRVVDPVEMTALNQTYRHKNSVTNVLSFPFEAPPGVPEAEAYLGDTVICADVVFQEADAQGKSAESHWAHLTVHSVLHLLGYDHVDTEEAEVMEGIEIHILDRLGYANPYEGYNNATMAQ